jgi:hypothetical protein
MAGRRMGYAVMTHKDDTDDKDAKPPWRPPPHVEVVLTIPAGVRLGIVINGVRLMPDDEDD